MAWRRRALVRAWAQMVSQPLLNPVFYTGVNINGRMISALQSRVLLMRFHPVRAAFFMALATTALVAPAAAAEGQGWTITLKGNAGVSPAWDGSKDLSPYLLPGLSVRRAGTPLSFSAPDDAVGFALLDESWLKAGPVGRLRGPRQQTKHNELRGVHDIDWTIEAGLFAEFWPMEKFRARIEVRQGFMGHHGLVADLYADWVERRGPWTVSFGPRMSLASGATMNKLYGVTVFDAFNNLHLAAYQPSGGLRSVGFAGAVTYDWSKAWSTTLYGKYARLAGPAGASPLVGALGSRNQVTLGLIVAYSFDWAGF